MKRLIFASTTSQYAYLDDIEENKLDYNDYFTTIKIEISEQEFDDEDFDFINEIEIGILEILLYNADSVIDNRESIIDVADSKNQEVSDALLALFKRNELKEKYKGENFTDNVLYLERLFIKPQYRGLNYGKRILNKLGKILSRLKITDYACMVMLPSAFEYEDSENYKDLLNDSEIPNGKKLTDRLYKFYKKYGFKAVTGSKALYKVSY